MNDFAVRAYVKRIDFENDAVFGVLDDELHLVGAVHLGRARCSSSVSPFSTPR